MTFWANGTIGPFLKSSEKLTLFLGHSYGMYSHVYTPAELRQIIVSDPFDRSEMPRHLKLVELVDWLEALIH